MKSVVFLVLASLCLTNHSLVAQGWLPMGARSNMLGNATVALVDSWSFHHNPGAVAEITSTSFGVSYENRFLLQELQSQGVVFAQPLKKGVISAGVQSYGFSLYRTMRAGIGYSMRLGDKISAGVQLNYMGIRLQELYGSHNTVTAEAGILAHITDNWTVGAAVFNIGRAKLDDFADDRYTTLIRIGTGYTVSSKVKLLAEAEKHIDYAVRLKTGVDYQVLSSFSLRGGFATQPMEFSFGAGYKFKTVQLDMGTAFHRELGWSPHFSITYQKK